MINLQRLKEHFDDDADLFQGSRELMLERVPDLLRQLKSAVANEDADAAMVASHTLKGMIGNFFAKDLVESLAQIEGQAKAGRLPQVEGLDLIEKSLDAFVEEVNTLSFDG